MRMRSSSMTNSHRKFRLLPPWRVNVTFVGKFSSECPMQNSISPPMDADRKVVEVLRVIKILIYCVCVHVSSLCTAPRPGRDSVGYSSWYSCSSSYFLRLHFTLTNQSAKHSLVQHLVSLRRCPQWHRQPQCGRRPTRQSTHQNCRP